MRAKLLFIHLYRTFKNRYDSISLNDNAVNTENFLCFFSFRLHCDCLKPDIIFNLY